MAKKAVDDASLTRVADAIRAKGGTSDALSFPDGFVNAVSAIQTGEGGAAPSAKASDVNFYDYDGTLLYGYTLEEAHALTELPTAPKHDGLVFQKWNYSLGKVKAATRKMDVGATYRTDDGKTHIFIHLEEGRTSPMLGVCPNGTVDVDWGDGTAHDTLTGTSTSTVKWTPNHAYAAPGDYVIKLTVTGGMGMTGNNSTNSNAYILRCTSGADKRNMVYQNSVIKVLIGEGVTSIGSSAFNYCYSLRSISIPDGVTSIGGYVFYYCRAMCGLVIPDSVNSIEKNAFQSFTSLRSVSIPDSVASIGDSAFNTCGGLSGVVIPDSVTSIGSNVFAFCYSLASIVIPNGVKSIGSNAFQYCYGVRFYDFTRHTSVPTLSSTTAFDSISEDCEIRVPAALYDEWIAATNWSAYADYIVGM